ncbi:hypothetical protein JF66_17145 [Cryobacterium sp. MLB-32]|uniref:type IV toxin-antitoxin system AbiEi family antitoxin domain-containing protein n=1 Tax=Cryobacterium sp. MLB-32 TaxID=1529318 RepID=UPI0004E78F3E|nr:hypothetical protein [Cryobacterium sp. MLB-32]KFF58630.1 hypothetical protein JF66_17145 [Cryobacterium sp. MLB-32]
MISSLEVLDTCRDGLIPSAALSAAGMNSHVVETLLRCGELVRVRRGIYAIGETWRSASLDGRYATFVRATALAAGRPLVFSHLSAASLHGLPIVGPWPKAVHVLSSRASGGNTARFTTSHQATASRTETVLLAGCRATSLARTLVDVAASSTFLIGVTMMDHALRVDAERMEAEVKRGIRPVAALTKDVLLGELAAGRPHSGAVQAERAIAFANPLSATPGESLSRVRIHELGFEVPELQVHFCVDGRDFWVDFYWRRVRKMAEFDGELKYTRGIVLADRDPGEVVFQEKKREDMLRTRANSFDRWVWEIAYSPRRFFDFLTDHGIPRA